MVCPQCGTENPNAGQADCTRCKKPLHTPSMQGKIVCAIHGNREATTGCGACGKRLCNECAVSASGVDFCEDCAPANAERIHHDEDYERIPIIDPAKGERAIFGSRFLGWVIDTALVFGIAIVISFISWLAVGSLSFLTLTNGGNGAGWWALRIVVILAAFVYNAVLTAMTGQTLGRQVAGVMVLDDRGHVLTLKASALRTAMSIVSFIPLGLGFLWALWDKKGETWHDKIAHTTAYKWEELT